MFVQSYIYSPTVGKLVLHRRTPVESHPNTLVNNEVRDIHMALRPLKDDGFSYEIVLRTFIESFSIRNVFYVLVHVEKDRAIHFYDDRNELVIDSSKTYLQIKSPQGQFYEAFDFTSFYEMVLEEALDYFAEMELVESKRNTTPPNKVCNCNDIEMDRHIERLVNGDFIAYLRDSHKRLFDFSMNNIVLDSDFKLNFRVPVHYNMEKGIFFDVSGKPFFSVDDAINANFLSSILVGLEYSKFNITIDSKSIDRHYYIVFGRNDEHAEVLLTKREVLYLKSLPKDLGILIMTFILKNLFTAYKKYNSES